MGEDSYVHFERKGSTAPLLEKLRVVSLTVGLSCLPSLYAS